MKKIIFFLFLILVFPLCVNAEDHIYSIDMNVYLDEKGDAHIIELWDVQADGGTQWCKKFSNLDNIRLDLLHIYMDDNLLELTDWNSTGSIEDKAGYYGIEYVVNGFQLCFGKSDMERHSFRIHYNMDNYVVNTDDSQIMYHVLAENATSEVFYANILTYYSLPNDLDVKKFGYDGNLEIRDGNINLSDSDGLKDQYVALLIKFPKNTFATDKKNNQFNTYEDALNHAEGSSYEYIDNVKDRFKFTFIDLVFVLLSIFVVLLIVELVVRRITGKSILKHKKVEVILCKITSVFKILFGKIKKIFMKFYRFIKNKFGKKNNM